MVVHVASIMPAPTTDRLQCKSSISFIGDEILAQTVCSERRYRYWRDADERPMLTARRRAEATRG